MLAPLALVMTFATCAAIFFGVAVYSIENTPRTSDAAGFVDVAASRLNQRLGV